MHILAIVDGLATIIATTIPVLRVLVRDEYRARFSYAFTSKRHAKQILRRHSFDMDFICRDRFMVTEDGQVVRSVTFRVTESLNSLKEPFPAYGLRE